MSRVRSLFSSLWTRSRGRSTVRTFKDFFSIYSTIVGNACLLGVLGHEARSKLNQKTSLKGQEIFLTLGTLEERESLEVNKLFTNKSPSMKSRYRIMSTPC